MLAVESEGLQVAVVQEVLVLAFVLDFFGKPSMSTLLFPSPSPPPTTEASCTANFCGVVFDVFAGVFAGVWVGVCGGVVDFRLFRMVVFTFSRSSMTFCASAFSRINLAKQSR